jgi:hypothetical protein
MQTAGVSICKNCQSSCLPDDNFCQDCGAPQSEQELETIALLVPPKALLTCLNCGAKHESLSRYCASCGSLLSDVGVFTTAAEEAEEAARPAPGLVNPTLVFPSNRTGGEPVLVKSVLLESPLLRGKIHPEQPARSQSYRAPNFLHTVVDLSPAILLLCFFALVVFWVVDADRVKGPAALQQAFVRARAQASAKQIDRSLKTMEELALARHGNLNADERQLLNDDLFAMAEIQAGKGNKKEAIFNLLQITADYSNYAGARDRVKELSALSASEKQNAHLKETTVAPAAKPQGSSGTTGAMPGGTAADKTAGGKDIASSGKGHNDEAGGLGDQRKSIMLLQQLHAPGTVPANPPESMVGGRDQSQSAKGSAAMGRENGSAAGQASNATGNAAHQQAIAGASRYSDADVAHYNKLLAEYFTKAHADGNQQVTGAGAAPDHGEPPTLSEWLSQGKPNF